MKIVIIGGEGTIGKKVVERLEQDHEVMVAGRNSGDLQVDMSDSDSIERLFQRSGDLDAIVVIAGDAKWDAFENLSEEDYYIGIKSKMMGQVNITRMAQKHLKDGGSITLTTGILADEPVAMTASAAMVNGAIQSFTKAVALELPRGLRINCVSADLVEDSFEKYKDYFPGNTPVPMRKVVDAYVKCIMGKNNGTILKIRA
ncbi:MAG: short chain dehydrogenase [Flavobacteriaceae bacterium]|nr:short chain dehydrogenase [Flavobacteriaceae bacterium]